jgi:hypothetical protein
MIALVSISAAAAGTTALVEQAERVGQAGQVGRAGQARGSSGRRVPLRPRAAVAISSSSGSLDVHVETPAAATVKVRIVLANRSQRGVLAVELAAFRGTEQIISERRRSPRNEPLVRGESEYAFEVAATFDRLVVSSVLWDDGSVEGDPGLLADERVLDIGKAAQIRRVMKLLREYQDPGERQTVVDLRARLGSLAVVPDQPFLRGTVIGMQAVKAAALEDLLAFEHAQPSPNASAWRTWLDQTISTYEDWLARIIAR